MILAMKKIAQISLLAGLSAITFLACNKEADAPDNNIVGAEDTPALAGESIEIIGTIKDDALTKTQYTENDGVYDFSWTHVSDAETDEIHLIVYSSTKQDKYRLYANESSKSTTFSGRSDIGDATGSDWTQTGFALYPVDVASNSGFTGIKRKDFLTYGYKDSFEKLTVTMSPSYDLGVDTDMNTQLSCTPLVGVRQGETNHYDFSTAVGVLMITLTGVPTSATGLRLISPSDEAPLSGTFLLKAGKPDIAMVNAVTGNNSRQVNFSVSTAGDYTFYIPVPVGTIPVVDGKGLKIQLLDGTDYPIFSRSYTKELTIVRNRITPVTLTAPEWKKLGTGKFMDNFMWDYMGFATSTTEEVGSVDVTFYQNVSNPTEFKVENPYGKAVEAFPSAGVTQGTHDDYLLFNVSAEGVTFTNCLSGLSINGHNIRIDYSASNNTKLIAGTASEPSVVSLAPIYQYSNDSGNWIRTGSSNMIRLVFPGKYEGLSGSMSSATADLSEVLYTKGSDAYGVILYVTDSPLCHFYAANSTVPGSCKTETAVSGSITGTAMGFGASGGTYDQTVSGIKYLTWVTRDADGVLYTWGSKKVILITPNQASQIVSQYARDVRYGSSDPSYVDLHFDNTLTIKVSDNPSLGNIMITEVAGYHYDPQYNTHTSLLSDFSNATKGAPIYGTFFGGYGNYAAGSNGALFSNLDSQIFYYDNGGYKHFIKPSGATTLRLAFQSDGHSPGITHDLVVWDTSFGNYYYSGGYGPDVTFSKYVAYKTKGRVNLAESMLSTNTSYGEGGTGDAGGMTALVDKNAGSSWWHSNWAGSVVTDEQGIYIQIDLTSLSKTVSSFTLKFLTRSNISHGLPSKYRIAVSKNGTDWQFATDEISIDAAAGTWFQQSVNAGDNYSYIRLCFTEMNQNNSTGGTQVLVNSTADGSRYTHLDELQLWEN